MRPVIGVVRNNHPEPVVVQCQGHAEGMNLTACQVGGGGWPCWPLECRGLDDTKTMQPYNLIRRAGDDPMVFAGPEPATTGSKGAQ